MKAGAALLVAAMTLLLTGCETVCPFLADGIPGCSSEEPTPE